MLLTIPAIAALVALLILYSFETNAVIEDSKKAFYDEAFTSTAAILNADRDLYQAQISEKNLYYNAGKLSSSDTEALVSDFEENAEQARDRISTAIENVQNNRELYEVFAHSTSNTTLAQLSDIFDAAYSEWLAAYDINQLKGDMVLRDSKFETAREQINLMTELLEEYAKHKSEDIIAEVNLSVKTATIVVGAVIFVITLIAINIIFNMRTGIKKLTEINLRISQGELDIGIENKYFTRDEIGQLYSATSQILLRLKEYIKYINEISLVLGRMAEGEIHVELEQEYVGEFKQLKTALLTISAGLHEALSSINESADQVRVGAEQVSDAAQALSVGATEQASSTEELAASINEVSNQVTDNSTNASKARELAKRVSQEVDRGSVQMNQMITAMNSISQSSEEIKKIIKTIDDIAFQTNILALNAAVEAARAGNEGKGFAVVADEVRNLAAKSAEAAKTTEALIEMSIAKIEEGAKFANSTAKSLDEIVHSVNETSTLIDRIDDATAQQAQAIFQISQGINHISSVVQTNSATAEESAATSEELAGQADMLTREVGKFKL